MTRLSMRIADPFMNHLAAPALAPTAWSRHVCAKAPSPTALPRHKPAVDQKAHRAARSAVDLASSRRHRIILERKLRLGTAEDNDWVLHDSYVSQHHALLTASEDRVLVQDCGSRNGTFVNGVRLQKVAARWRVLRLSETEMWLARKPQPTAWDLLA